jgi:hypothetical protein
VRTTVAALSEVCRADAAEGIAKIRESVGDTGERTEIDRIAKGMAPTRRLVCRMKTKVTKIGMGPIALDQYRVITQFSVIARNQLVWAVLTAGTPRHSPRKKAVEKINAIKKEAQLSAVDAANNALDRLKRDEPDAYAELLRERQGGG